MVSQFVNGIGIFIRAVVSEGRMERAAQAGLDTVHSWLAQVTPAGWLAALLGLVALVLVGIVGPLVPQLMRQWMDQDQRDAELDGGANVRVDRTPVSPRTAEYEALWK